MKKLKLLLIPSIILFFLTACFAIPIGDGKKVKLSKSGITFIDEDGQESSLSIDTDEGSVQFTGPDNQEVNVGLNVDLPKDFPDYIPIAEDAVIYTSSSNFAASLVIYGTKLSYEQILQTYEDFYQSHGFDSVNQEDLTLSEEHKQMIFTGQKEEKLIMVTLTSVEGDMDTKVQIQLSDDPYYDPSENED